MKNLGIKTLFFLFMTVLAGIFADRYFFDRKISNFGASIFKNQASYLFSGLESSGFFFSGLVSFGNIVSENEALRKENMGFLSRLADYEDIKKENEFFRKALDISPRFNNKIVYANIYRFQLGPDGYDVLLNKGTEDGIADGDVIITEEGVLVGRIEKAYVDFARVLVISDTDFSVTANVLNSDTAGIARGALDKGLYFDLIVQSDLIKEGDVVVSSGMDMIPPALMVGMVDYVETKDTDLFKKVKIKPAMDKVRIGRVLIIRN